MNLDKIFKTIDVLIGVRDIARDKTEEPQTESSVTPSAGQGIGGQIEKHLTNVLVAALREAFERDTARLELERSQLEEQKRRADEMMRLESVRHAADRELAGLRFLSGTAMAGWIASLVLLVIRSGRAASAPTYLLALGSLLILASVGTAFTAQGRISARALRSDHPPDSDPAGGIALWLLLGGLALSAVSLVL